MLTRLASSLALFLLSYPCYAQQPAATVPRLVRFAGTLVPSSGRPLPSSESVTLAVYRDQTGGSPLWQEIQNVAIDAEGRYSLLMGLTLNDGMPVDLFNSGEPRWLGVQINKSGEVEQPRVLLVSVPYALKASDADTLGGKPASAYLLANAAPAADRATSTATPVSNNAIRNHTFLPTPKSSLINENNGFVGIGTTNPLISLDVRIGSLPQMGIAGNTDYLTFFASDQFGPAIYWDPGKDLRFGKGGTSLYNPFGFVEQMRIQSNSGNVGIGTQTPSAKLDVAGDINLNGAFKYLESTVLKFDPTHANLAIDFQALSALATGGGDIAIGAGALERITRSVANVAIGENALNGLTDASVTADQNTAIGNEAGLGFFSGTFNTFVGSGAGTNGAVVSNSSALGAKATVTRSSALILGGTDLNSVTVGIGTSNPFNGYSLDVENSGALNSGVVVNAAGCNIYLGMTNGVHKFRVDNNGVIYGASFQTSGADFAESVEVAGAKSLYEPGDLLVIDLQGTRRLALSQKPYATSVAGIYSTKPGMLATPHSIGEPLTGEVPLAVVGIVPCKVTAENGAIRQGDLLVSSSRPGYAMKGTDRKRLVGAVVGKALEPLPNGTGVIQVLVTLQ